MLAYASNQRVAARRQSSPHAMLFIVSAHVALLAAVMSAKMDLARKIQPAPKLIPIAVLPVPPSHRPPPPALKPLPTNPIIKPPLATPEPLSSSSPPAEAQPSSPNTIGVGGGGAAILPEIPRPAATAPVRNDPRLLTPSSELKPPYPASKLASEEEARLRLRLTINEAGRVVSVDPVGSADREFLDAARRYILAHWRYDPATEDGRPVVATTVIMLTFQLDG